MRLFRYALTAILFVILGVAIYQTMLWLGVWGSLNASQVMPLDEDDQEIAFIEPATGGDDWGRLVTALQLLQADWPRINPTLPVLRINLDGAFPPLTAEVPEIIFSFANVPKQKLRLRWYKISGEHDAGSWVQKLKARGRSPLAVIGGGTSDRAVKLAARLRDNYTDLAAPAPLLLLTTATSEETKKGKPLIEVYKDRTFRFSFTNQKMVEALLQFAQHRQYPEEARQWGAGSLWVDRSAEPAELAMDLASTIGVGAVWHGCAVLSSVPQLQPYVMHTVSWQDERYSQDMADRFEKEFRTRYPAGVFFAETPIGNGVGEFFQPAPLEQVAVSTFITDRRPIAPHSFLVLPTQTVRMRRFLINLRQRAPLEARKLVVLNGDAVTFHSVYRDREVIWNILDLPYSLVFFSHRNPIDRSAGFTWTTDDRSDRNRTTTGTHDILLYRDLFEAFLYAASDNGKLLSDPLKVRDRLRATCWYHPPAEKRKDEAPRVCNPAVHALDAEHQRFFDAAGNRQTHTGEHIVWVKPSFTEDLVDLKSKISVWSLQPAREGGGWQLGEARDVYYNQQRLEGAAP